MAIVKNTTNEIVVVNDIPTLGTIAIRPFELREILSPHFETSEQIVFYLNHNILVLMCDGSSGGGSSSDLPLEIVLNPPYADFCQNEVFVGDVAFESFTEKELDDPFALLYKPAYSLTRVGSGFASGVSLLREIAIPTAAAGLSSLSLELASSNVSDTSMGIYLTLYDSNNNADPQVSSRFILPSASRTYVTQSIDSFGGTYVADSSMALLIRMVAGSEVGSSIRLGTLALTFKGRV